MMKEERKSVFLQITTFLQLVKNEEKELLREVGKGMLEGYKVACNGKGANMCEWLGRGRRMGGCT